QRGDGAQRWRWLVVCLVNRFGRARRTVRATAAIDFFLEPRQQPLAFPQPALDFIAPIGLEPIALTHALEPATYFLEVLLDFFGLLEGVVLTEVFELDLFDELRFALFDDLGVLARSLRAERVDDPDLIFGLQFGDIQQERFAAQSGNLGGNLVDVV